MANWCSNSVAFEGNPEAIEQVQELFNIMAEQEKQDGKGQLPDFIQLDNGYFFDIYQTDGDIGILNYQTKWSPNIEIVEKIANHYKLDFVQDYEEMGNGIYGQATFKSGILDDVFLEDEDFEQYEYDEENECYHFESKIYESDSEILETLLERKIAKQQP